ncbi:HNH endonuclease [Maritalea porphyrae]|uniref:HNH endonuclease n=1 Tax=Maritalea porphyrae TaxID=880732 RepID=UPI0022B0025D|nr:hypothetical protein [Maritalea porphyrae]MCZ4270772.1 hypothetical protein [Maritalea porphyrae]
MASNNRKLIIKRRQESFIRQGGLCFYCNKPMWEGEVESKTAAMARLGVTRTELKLLMSTAEHLLRKADGGGNCRDNIVAAHAICNHSREERTVEEHKATLWIDPPADEDPRIVEIIDRLKVVKDGSRLHTELMGKFKALRTHQLAEQIGYNLQVTL